MKEFFKKTKQMKVLLLKFCSCELTGVVWFWFCVFMSMQLRDVWLEPDALHNNSSFMLSQNNCATIQIKQISSKIYLLNGFIWKNLAYSGVAVL